MECDKTMYDMVCGRRFDEISRSQETGRAETAKEMSDLAERMDRHFTRFYSIMDGDGEAVGLKGRVAAVEMKIHGKDSRAAAWWALVAKIAAGVLIVLVVKVLAGSSPMVAQWLAR